MGEQEDDVEDDGWRPARRHNAATTRHPLRFLRARSSLGEGVEQIVTKVMDCAFTVHRHLGPGFKEKIYQRALGLEMDSIGLKFECEKAIDVRFKDWRIPGQRVDLVVERQVLVEVKTVPRLRALHRSQVLSYLKTMDLRIGLLINFNCPVLKDSFKRVVR